MVHKLSSKSDLTLSKMLHHYSYTYMTKAIAFHFSNFARESSFLNLRSVESQIDKIYQIYLPLFDIIYTEQTYNPSSLLHITTHGFNLNATYPPRL